MTKSMKVSVLFLALTVAQASVIPAGYADDESGTDAHKTHKARQLKHAGENGDNHTASPERNGVRSFAPAPVKSYTATPIQTYTPTPVKTYSPSSLPTLNTSPAPAPTPAPAPVKSWALYNQYCAGCHGIAKQGASAALIQTGINTISAMSSLSSLTAAQVAAIAAGQ